MVWLSGDRDEADRDNGIMRAPLPTLRFAVVEVMRHREGNERVWKRWDFVKVSAGRVHP